MSSSAFKGDLPALFDASGEGRWLQEDNVGREVEGLLEFSGRALSYEVTSLYFRKYRKLAKLPDTLTFHSLRKTYGTVLASAGVPLRTIQKMLGHSDTTITARTYADVMTDAARRQVQAAFGEATVDG